jgi:drug/metabolite transporter (DMT)-like permease
MSVSWLLLALAVLAYGVANLLQAAAADRVTASDRLDPRLLLRLTGQWTYLAGVACQAVGFGGAFLARRDLPLFVVQTAVAAGFGVTAVLGVVVLRWRLPRAEIGLLAALAAGLAAVIGAAEVGASQDLTTAEAIALAVAAAVVTGLALGAARLSGPRGAVALGVLSGTAFSAAAVAARPLAAARSPLELVTDPLLILVVVHTVLGQLLLNTAMQRGSTTAAVASMDAAAAVPAAALGLLLLGDRVLPGRGWLAAVGFVVAVGAVVLLARYAGDRSAPAPDPEHQLM